MKTKFDENILKDTKDITVSENLDTCFTFSKFDLLRSFFL